MEVQQELHNDAVLQELKKTGEDLKQQTDELGRDLTSVRDALGNDLLQDSPPPQTPPDPPRSEDLERPRQPQDSSPGPDKS